jgi:hypothetical protein
MFMTAISSAESRLQGFEIGADQFLPTPDDSGDAR